MRTHFPSTVWTQFGSTVWEVGSPHWSLLFQDLFVNSLWNAPPNPPRHAPFPLAEPGWGRGQGTGTLSSAALRGQVSLLPVPSSQEPRISSLRSKPGLVGSFLKEAAVDLEGGWEISGRVGPLSCWRVGERLKWACPAVCLDLRTVSKVAAWESYLRLRASRASPLVSAGAGYPVNDGHRGGLSKRGQQG